MSKPASKVIHITKALAGEVLNVIKQLAQPQAQEGLSVSFVHSLHPDTPNEKSLAAEFPAPIGRIILPMATNISPFQDLKSLVLMLRLIKSCNLDVIHAHSSKAGVLGRIACRWLGRHGDCFYTPHGYSFLRKNVSKYKRYIFLSIEQASSLLGGTTAACSRSELNRTIHDAWKKTVLVENSIPLESTEKALGSSSNSSLIATSGRICPQKNPSFFL